MIVSATKPESKPAAASLVASTPKKSAEPVEKPAVVVEKRSALARSPPPVRAKAAPQPAAAPVVTPALAIDTSAPELNLDVRRVKEENKKKKQE